MTTEQALLVLLACLTLAVVAIGARALARLSGSVKLDLDLGSQALARALHERDQARAVAGALRAGMTEASQVTQPLQGVTGGEPVEVPATVEDHPEASVRAVVYPAGRET